MAVIIVLVLALASASVVSAQEKCVDMLGNCNQMPKTLCTAEKSQEQMKNLCAKTCGYCTPKPKKDEPVKFSAEIFLLYLKNDIKFLKEEIIDIKHRLRDVTTRQQRHYEMITSRRQVDSENSVTEGQKGPNMGQDMGQGENFAEELKKLKEQTLRLTARIQDQNNRFSGLTSSQGAGANTEFSAKLKRMSDEIIKLSGDLRTYSQQIQDLSSVGADLADFKENSRSRTDQLQRSTTSSIEELKNSTRTMTEGFLKSLGQFNDVLDKERLRNSVLEQKLSKMNTAFRKEQQKTAGMEKLLGANLALGTLVAQGGMKTERLAAKLQNVTRDLIEQDRKSNLLQSLVAELSKRSSNITTEQLRTRSFLAYQYNYIVRYMKSLVVKLGDLEKYSKNVINRTLIKVNRSMAQGAVMTQLSTKVNELANQIVTLQQEGDRRQPRNRPNPGPSSGSDSGSNVDLRDLKMKVATNEDRLTVLDAEVKLVRNNSENGIRNIKQSIADMALLRNNDSSTVQEVHSRYQQGIMALLGPQRSNTTRFFNPRIAWHNSSLGIYGYIALNHEGEWGTICDDNFDDREAQVLCRMSGYKGGIFGKGQYSVSDGKINGRSRTDYRIWVDELRCKGDEATIQVCRTTSDGWGDHDCDHGEDVGVLCYIS